MTIRSFRSIYAHILIFLCIYIEFSYTIVVANYLSGPSRYFILLCAILPTLILFKHSNRTDLSLILFLYSTIIIIISVIRDSTLEEHFLLFVKLLVGYLIATRLPFTLMIKSYCNIVYFLTLYSLFFYFLCAIIPSVSNVLPYIGGFHDTNAAIHNALFTVVSNGMEFPRNFGLAWEPGAFAILICIAVFCMIHCYEAINKKRLIIYSIGIITTFSTMGYIVLAIIYVSLLFKNRQKNLNLIIIAAILIFATLQIPFMKELTFGKLEGLFSSSENVSETTAARLNAIIYPGMAFLENPFTGVGYREFRIINETMCNNVATNTVVNWLAIFGIWSFPFIFFYLFAIYQFQKNKVPLYIILLTLFGAIFMISTESLLRISIIYVIIFIGTLKVPNIKIASNG